MTDARAIAADPQWFPDALDAGRGLIRFARISRDALSAEAFLDHRKNKSVTGWAEAKIDDLAAHVPQSPSPSFIFHSAFCGSTLLARALDAPGKALSLKEPNILLDLVNARRVTPALQTGSQYERFADVVLSLLARRHGADERIVIKPTNTASPFAAFALSRKCPAVFLYGGLKDFLISMLKKREDGRAFVRLQYNIFSLDRTGLSAIEPRKAMSLTDLQVAALIWRHQLEEFERLLASAPGAASLDYDTMIADPCAALIAVSRQLDLPLQEEEIRAVAGGEIFQTNSKFTGDAYDGVRRKSENLEIERQFDAELKMIEKWVEPLTLGVTMKPPLSKALKV